MKSLLYHMNYLKDIKMVHMVHSHHYFVFFNNICLLRVNSFE